MSATDMLPEVAPMMTDWEVRKTRRKRRMCKLAGHLFYAEGYDTETGIATLECRRCWPHIDSIRYGQLYDLMPRLDSTEIP